MRREFPSAWGETTRRRCAWTRLPLLVLSVMVSAYFMSVAVGSVGFAWLAWISLLPLFLAIRLLAPRKALLCGALWGGCILLFSLVRGDGAISPTLRSLVLLTAVPALYAYLGARLTRRLGFSPLLLALGWVGVEITLRPLGLSRGLLAGTQAGGPVMQLIGGLLGYAFVAFLVAFANAWLLSIASDIRLADGQPRYLPRSDDERGWLVPQTSLFLSLLAVRPAQARAPPAQF